MQIVFDNARKFIFRNARPIDLARWQYHFENGGKEAVLDALVSYQNDDGGFGHALEADCWNPISSPIQTWNATEILREIGMTDSKHPIIRGILRYLSSGADFDGRHWHYTIPSNNGCAHAPWWTYQENQTETDNPTAALAGFIVRYADRESDLYRLGCYLCKKVYETFCSHKTIGDMHLIATYIQMMIYLEDVKEGTLIDLTAFRQTLLCHANYALTRDTAQWESGYVCRPSRFIDLKKDGFFKVNGELAQYECEFLRKAQLPDGSWNVPWGWQGYEEQWHISKNWWKTCLIIENILFLRKMNRLDG